MSVWNDYLKGVDYNNAVGLYSTVETNENFFIGKQWEGVVSNGLPTPVFNFIRRIVLFLEPPAPPTTSSWPPPRCGGPDGPAWRWSRAAP